MEGGYARSARTVVSNEWPCDGRMVSFVRINKTSLWLLKLCGGKRVQKGALRTTRAIEKLRSLCQLSNTENGTDGTPEKAAVADVHDPMQELDNIEVDTTEQRVNGRKRKRGGCTGVIQRVSMAERFNATQLRTVRVVLTP